MSSDEKTKFTLLPNGEVLIERFDPGNNGTLPPGTLGVMRRVAVPLADLVQFVLDLPIEAVMGANPKSFTDTVGELLKFLDNRWTPNRSAPR